MSPFRVVILLSAGRCGTQWLATTLRDSYPGKLEVEHEPLGPLYRPRRFFRRYDEPDAVLEIPQVRRHVERIAASRHYVETGWPSFPILPLLAERFADRLRVIHLTRHPVPTALSHLAHQSYAGSPRADAYTELATLGPEDPNVFQPRYAGRWDELSPYAKCLFWWTEVQLFGFEFAERYPQSEVVRVRSEDMLRGARSAIERLLDAVGLPSDDRLTEQTNRRVDRWHHHTDQPVDPLEVVEHPATVEVAKRLGYDVEKLDLAALEARYRGEPDPGEDRAGRFR